MVIILTFCRAELKKDRGGGMPAINPQVPVLLMQNKPFELESSSP
jgi:hypothetical protein